jgi:hypothetical protein
VTSAPEAVIPYLMDVEWISFHRISHVGDVSEGLQPQDKNGKQNASVSYVIKYEAYQIL